jgi:DNA polymerase III delta prime subunit
MSNKTKFWTIITILLIIFCSGITILLFNTETLFNKIGWVATLVSALLTILVLFFHATDTHSTPVSPEKPKTRALLLRLLERVEHDWVVGILENSVHHAALLELGMESQPSQVANPWERTLEVLGRENRLLPAEVTIGQVFQEEAKRSLLILGEPGSGKTTTLLQLAKELIAPAREDEQLPIPVVFNLSSWAMQRLPLSEWLVKELSSKYHFPQELGNEWLQNYRLLPLLDGLDEVQAAVRAECVQAINTFAQTAGAGVTGLVVCCRRAEYEALKTTRLQLKAAISLQPLEPAQINYYLARGGEQLAGLRSLLAKEEEMRALAQSPLMLSIMSLAYQDVPVSEVTHTSPSQPSDKQSQLFDRYVEKMFTRRKEPAIYPQAQVIQGLSWLASQMQQRGQTVFLLENLQPDWLPWLPTRLGYWSLVGLFGGLLGGLLGGQLSGSFLGILVGGLVGFLLVAFLGDTIGTMEMLGWSWEQLRKKLPAAMLRLMLLFGGLFGGLFILLSVVEGQFLLDNLLDGLSAFAFVSLFMGLLFSPLFGLKNQIPDSKAVVNQGIVSSLKNMVRFGIPFGLWAGVFLGIQAMTDDDYCSCCYKPPVYFWFLMSVLMGPLMLGGIVVLPHYTLRLLLFLKRYTPWNYVRFLDYATRLILLRKVGGGYVFIHRLLLEHLAEKWGE